MEFNLLIAGVGGQGILTIAQIVSRAAMESGYEVRQSEVHGMSQRGGEVHSFVRIADHPLGGGLISRGRADLILAVEPLEALRNVEYLRERGAVVSNSVPFANMPDYPPADELLKRIAAMEHVLINAPRLARAAGSAHTENIVVLGAASAYIPLSRAQMRELIGEAFAYKGQRVVDINQRAFDLGERLAEVYREGLQEGRSSSEMLKWLELVPQEELAAVSATERIGGAAEGTANGLSDQQVGAISDIMHSVSEDGRVQLFEHEVYRIVELAGAIVPPRHRLVRPGETLGDEDLAGFTGERVVLKIVSPQVVHKSEAEGLAFVLNRPEIVNREIDRLVARHMREGHQVAGVLVVEFVEQVPGGFGSELFVGIRRTREFGPVIAAGLGGVDAEYLAGKLLPWIAVAKAAALDTAPGDFFKMFQTTAAYEVLVGQARGHQRLVSDAELLRCFRAFVAIARTFCQEETLGTCLEELEVNPFGFRRQRLVPLDGRARLGQPASRRPDRPADRIERMLEPEAIAVVGVSSTRANFGRIILNNIQDCGFPQDHLYVVKPGTERIDGVRCISSLAIAPERIDLVVAAIAGEQIPDLVDQAIAADGPRGPGCSAVVLIPGGLGEKEGTQEAQAGIREAIAAARISPGGGPVFLGGNCMGIRSRPGGYDTFFIPKDKLDPRRGAPPRRAALISQSGAFVITRMSNLQCLDPMFAVSLGNQVDVTVADVLEAMARRDDVDCMGVYVEGFNDLDGLAFVRSVERAVAAGKIVVFYKAGRTAVGRSAAQGHTASVAGDYDVCQAAVGAAGAIVTDTFKEFEQLVELATDLHAKKIRGCNIGAISNAGYEAVGMADTLKGTRYHVQMPALSDATAALLRDRLADHGLTSITDAKNPLDLTPMATDEAYEDSIRIMLEAEEIDAVIVGCVPMTPQLLTTPGEIVRPDSIAQRITRLFRESPKPLIFVVDCAEPYDDLAKAVRSGGVPVFRSADQAVRSLGRYLLHRSSLQARGDSRPAELHAQHPSAVIR